ncbi:MAG: hypothetical protein ACKO8Z_14035 [Prosthecobacter sp.]
MQQKSFLQRNWYLFTPLVIIIIPLIMAVNSMVNWGYGFSESMNALVHFGSTDTRYAIGFSELGFKTLRKGMDGRMVYSLIKNPFERQQDDTVWLYSLPQSGATYYHERSVIFEKDSQGIPRVKQVVSRFHTPDMK